MLENEENKELSASRPLRHTFTRDERLKSKKLIQELFDKGSSFYLSPLKVLYLPYTPEDGKQNQVLVTVPKRLFKKAVTRNKIRRRIKEAYRLHKYLLTAENLKSPLLIAYIYIGKEVLDYKLIEKQLIKSLSRLRST